MKEKITTHLEEIGRLKKIEGQIRGIQRMIEEKRYCVDILIQIASIKGAIKKVEESILERHLRGCVRESFKNGSTEDRTEKINEIIEVLRKSRR